MRRKSKLVSFTSQFLSSISLSPYLPPLSLFLSRPIEKLVTGSPLQNPRFYKSVLGRKMASDQSPQKKETKAPCCHERWQAEPGAGLRCAMWALPRVQWAVLSEPGPEGAAL